MKQAIGDLNLTIIIVIAVAGLVALFSLAVWPMIKDGLNQSTNCSDAICRNCDEISGMCDCTMPNGSGDFQCPFKG